MFDLPHIVSAFGYLGVAALVFTESGLLIGLFFPGDSLLFTAGFLASQHVIAIVPLIICSTFAAIIGDNVGYWLGRRYGRSVFTREGSIFLSPKHITRAEQFYAKYGSKALIIARFTPIIRTIAPLLAGVGSMNRSTFMRYNVIGGVLWGAGMPLLGYWLGSAIPNVDRYIEPIAIVIVLISIAPTVWHVIRERRNNA